MDRNPGPACPGIGGRHGPELWPGISRNTQKYVHGPGADEPVLWYEGSGAGDRRYYHHDERGSVVAISNGAAAAFAIKTYDEYGVPGGSAAGRFAYTGQTWLSEVGLYYYKARMYSPSLGRFMQTDPIGYKDGINWYGYVNNDPINRFDPTGLSDFDLTNPNAAAIDGVARRAAAWNTDDYDISAHGDYKTGQVVDTTHSANPTVDGGPAVSPEGLVRQATGWQGVLGGKGFAGHGYKSGMPIRLGACGISLAYAARVSSAAGAVVYFTRHSASYSTDANGQTVVTPTNAAGRVVGWESVVVRGNKGTYTNENGQTTSFTFNSRTGVATQSTPDTGTRILKKVCVDPNTCGGS